MDHLKQIKALLKEGLIIPVAGAGVSVATAGIPNWKQLVDHGLQYAREQGEDAMLILEAQSLSDSYQLTKAATIVKRLLNAPDHPFSNWLNGVFGRPEIKDTKLIQSIQNLCQPIIATTNYDQLLTTVGTVHTNRALDWKQHQEIQLCINKREPFILHLHGIYLRPDTPIFGDDDYEILRKETGYKTVLTNLWMNRHFLFIGCSRDGVMDEDFLTVLKLMQEWFPGDQREHYILMPNNMVGTDQHRELLRSCNVHLVPFGDKYDELPRFINSLNPNVEEMIRRFDHRRSMVHDGVVSILEAQPSYKLSPDVIDFIQSNLGIKHHWVAANRVEVFDKALKEYNSQQINRQKQFANNQVLARTEISVVVLEEKIALWNKHRFDVSYLNNIEFIDTAIVAFEMLQSFGSEVLNDIHRRHYNLIHGQYFSGDLNRYYYQAKEWKEEGSDFFEFQDNNYFFENLKRIMQSLLDVLLQSSEEIYGEKTLAKVVRQVPPRYLVIVHPKLLTLRESQSPYEVLAELPWDKNLEFRDAFTVLFEGKKIIIGYNSDHCFRWNPQEELMSANFFTVDPKDVIVNAVVLSQGENLILEVYTVNQRVVIVNFSSAKRYELSTGKFHDYIRLPQLNKIFCTVSIYAGQKGNCLFEVNSIGDYTPKISLDEVWELLKNIPVITSEYQDFVARMGDKLVENSYFDSYIQDVLVSPAKWLNRDILIAKVRFHVGFNLDSTALLFIDPVRGFMAPLSIVLFHHKKCFSYDIVSVNGQVNLIVGYLDSGDVGYLLQYLENINATTILVATDERGLAPQDKLTSTKIRDMYDAFFARADRAFANESGKVLYDIVLPELSFTMTEFENRLISVRYYE